MSQFVPSDGPAPGSIEVRRVDVRTFELLRRGFDLMGDQYWLMVLIVLVGVIVGSAVPLNLLLGPMLVGIFLCFAQLERWRKTEFGALFRGFDHFLDSFIVTLILMAIALAITAILITLVFGAIFVSIAAELPEEVIFLLVIASILVALPFFMLAYLPFVFAYQLVADRRLGGVQAVRLSLEGVRANLWGVLVFVVACGVISLLATMMCYLPAFLFMPIQFAASFLLYRDIFGASEYEPPALSVPQLPVAS